MVVSKDAAKTGYAKVGSEVKSLKGVIAGFNGKLISSKRKNGVIGAAVEFEDYFDAKDFLAKNKELKSIK